MAKRVKRIIDTEDLERVIKRSNRKPVFIFKHDAMVPESEDAFQAYLDFIEDTEEDILFTAIYAREDAELAEEMEALLDLGSDVPQLVLLMDEEVVWDDSKENINFNSISDVVNEYVSV